MKNLVYVFIIALFCSCSENQVEKSLREYVEDMADGFNADINYRLGKYEILDTLTNQDILDSLTQKLEDEAFVLNGLTKDSLIVIRDTSFPDYYMDDYDSFTEITKHRNTVDSLIEVFGTLSPYTYEVNYEKQWFKLSRDIFYNKDSGEDFKDHFNGMVENEENYRKADSLYRLNKDDIYAYKILHEYSIYNPMLKKDVEISRIVLLNKEMKFISSEILNDVGDMIKQITE